jgi:4-hydroxy-2-oxoglutarate aldolase
MPPHTNEPDMSLNGLSLQDSDDSNDNNGGRSAYSQFFGEIGSSPRPLVPGTYAPTPAFFDPTTEELDITVIRKHAVRLAEAGLQGIVTQGSNGEAVHLSHSERRLVTAATREALDSAGYHHIPVIVGCGAQSTRETVELCHDAMVSGGDYAMILPPSYYRTLYTGESQLDFFQDVANESPIPILIYNFPGAVGGIDLDSDTVTKLSRHPNIVGCKLTCGNTGKLARVASAAPAGFMTMGGSADFTLQTLVVGGKGVIGGLANIAPRACGELFNLYTSGKTEMAEKMQAVVARGDWVAIKGGVVSTKSCLNSYFQYGGFGRRPLPRLTPHQDEAVKAEFEELMLLEEFLQSGNQEDDIHFDKMKEFPQLVELERLLALA